jgi:hypothetical protein
MLELFINFIIEQALTAQNVIIENPLEILS